MMIHMTHGVVGFAVKLKVNLEMRKLAGLSILREVPPLCVSRPFGRVTWVAASLA